MTMTWWTSKPPFLKNSAKKLKIPTDGSWPWRSTLLFTWASFLMKHEPWFSSIGCPKAEEKPLPRLGSPSLKTNISLKQTRIGPKSRKPSKQHLPPIIHQHRLKLPLPCLTKIRGTHLDSTNTSSPCPSSSFTPESLTIMPCWSHSSMFLTPRSPYNSLSAELLRPPPPWRSFTLRPQRLKRVTTTLPPSGEDPSHHMEEVAVTMTPTLWAWIALSYHYPWSNVLITCTRTTAPYVTRKAVLLEIILLIIATTQLVAGAPI